MTTTRASCGVLDATLQGSGVERCAARLVRAIYLPRSGDEDNAASTPAARRQRRHRARRKQGRFVVAVEVTCEMITALVDQGNVDEANTSDQVRVNAQLGEPRELSLIATTGSAFGQ